MSAMKTMDAATLADLLRQMGRDFPNGASRIARHIAALEKEIAAAEARGFERARDMAGEAASKAAREAYVRRDNTSSREWYRIEEEKADALVRLSDDIRAMQDRQT